MSIELHIERLVLEGMPLAHGQERQLRAALQRQLAALLSTDGAGDWLRGRGSVPGLQGAPMRLDRDAGAAQWGRRIAGSVFAGLTR
jgi:hypothetical protein